MRQKTYRQWMAIAGLVVLLSGRLGYAQEQTSPASAPASAQGEPAVSDPASKRIPIGPDTPFVPKPIVIDEMAASLEERLDRIITLDVRDMNVVDVLKFLALQGNFNLVTSAAVQGRVTLYLKNVLIRDALDIILISNGLAYHKERDIVHVMTEMEYQDMFGKKFNDKNVVEIIQLKYAKPDYIQSALENLKSNLGRIIIDNNTGTVVMIDTPASVDRMKRAISEMEAPLETVVYTLKYAKVADVLEKFQARIDTNLVGSVSIDERTNKLIVRAFPGRREELASLIQSLDEPTKEVLIEARVLQVVFKPNMDYGIDWNLDFRNSGYAPLQKLNFSNLMLDENNLTSSDNLYSSYAKIGYGDISTNNFDVAIRALKQVSDTKILSNPKLLVTNNEEAKIHVGDTVPYIISTTSGTGENAITSEEVEFVDVGLKLSVIPNINDEGFITMTLKPELSTVVGNIDSEGGGIPQVNKTLVETTVMVKDGMTVVMGGLKKDNKAHVTKGVPVLMNLPWVGNFFKSVSDQIESTEIVIFITPHIVKGNEDDYDFYRGALKDFQSLGKEKLELKTNMKVNE